jgi:hypothetical protein
MRVAVLVLDQAEALPLLAFLSDALDVLTAISAWVQQRAVGAHGNAVLLDFPELNLRIILDYKGYQQQWCLHPWPSRGVCVCRDSFSQAYEPSMRLKGHTFGMSLGLAVLVS